MTPDKGPPYGPVAVQPKCRCGDPTAPGVHRLPGSPVAHCDAEAGSPPYPPVTDEAVELVLRKHLPVPIPGSDVVLCLCDVTRSYDGPIGHRLHVAAELRRAGLLARGSDDPAHTDGAS